MTHLLNALLGYIKTLTPLNLTDPLVVIALTVDVDPT